MKSRRGFLLAIFGPDGSGKSTTANLIENICRDNGLSVHRYHWRPGVLPSSLHSENKGFDITHPNDLQLRSLVSSLCMYLYYFYDFLLGYFFRFRSLLKRGTTIIYERYYYDLQFHPARYRLQRFGLLAKILSKIVPRPDLIVLLKAKPFVILDRKPELPSSEIERQQNIMAQSLIKFGKVLSIDTSTTEPAHVADIIYREMFNNGYPASSLADQSKSVSGLSLLIGPLLKHRVEGAGIAFDYVIKTFRKKNLPYKVIDIGPVDSARTVGIFTLGRCIEILKALIRYWWYLLFTKRIYLLVGVSTVAFLRDLLMIWSAKLLRCRITLHVHSGAYGDFYKEQPNWIKNIISKTLKQADAIVVLGNLLRSQFSFLSEAEDKLYVVPNTLSLDSTINTVKEKILKPPKPIRLLFLSNLIESKGYLDCLEACNLLHNKRKVPVRFDLCGKFIQCKTNPARKTEQELIGDLKEQIKSLGLSEVVSYHGVVTSYAKQRLLIESNILILPTYYAWEGQPICIIEALAYATPVIATNFRGIPEQVIDNYNGFLVTACKPNEIADRVEYMWNEPRKYYQMSLNARQHFDKNFTRKAHIETLMPIILGS